MVNRILLYLMLFGWVLFAWGCVETDLIFKVRYDQVAGLQENDPIYFQGNEIGHIRKVTYTKKGDYLVEVSVKPGFKNAATVDSKFFINEDPSSAENKYLTVEQGKPGGMVLERDAIVKGSVVPGLLQKMMSGLMSNADRAEGKLQQKLQQLKQSLQAKSRSMDADLELALDALSAQLHSFNSELQKVPDSAEVKELEKMLKGVGKDLKAAQRDVRNSVRDELIPELRRELEQIRERLRKYNRQEEMDPVEERAEELTRI
ncbi:MAG: MlaD family protein [Desulfobulbaceae bacterium]|nr:MlaD family protein [Desulfobulbaceae bacterium]